MCSALSLSVEKFSFKKLGKKRIFIMTKKYHKFDADNRPETLTQFHIFKTFHIKLEDFLNASDDVHVCDDLLHDDGHHVCVYFHAV